MRYALELVNFPDVGDPLQVVRFADAAERAGWDGLFMWDHLGFTWGAPSSDPWICLAAVAARTDRLVLGTTVSPIPRYQPHLLAAELATLDRLSGGRMVLGAGLGGNEDFAPFGGPEDLRERALLADEALTVIDGLWSGDRVQHEGAAYIVRDVTLSPLPIQRPRIPIWIGGTSQAALRRAARWDGWMAAAIQEDGTMAMTADELATSIARIGRLRDQVSDGRRGPWPFEVTIDGQTESDAAGRGLVASFAAAGATWWFETLHGYRGDIPTLMARVEAGPPR